MKRSSWPLAIALILLFALVAPSPWAAQEPETAEAKKETQAKAREARIQEYVRKKEERLARREAEAKRKQDEVAAKKTADDLAKSQTPVKPVAISDPAESAEKTNKKADRKRAKQERQEAKRGSSRNSLPRGLAKIHQTLQDSAFGQDPTVASYLELIAAGDASAQQIAAFGNFLGQANRAGTALAYYDLALSLDDQDTTIWLNAGTLQRQAGNLGAAAGAYSEVLGIDPSNAFAHYNLGAVLDEMGQYDNSIEEYKLALTIDPTLGDPAINPQAANNEKLMAVRMLLYKEQAGSLGLPLVTVPKGEIEGGK